jgi:hypothetical protein
MGKAMSGSVHIWELMTFRNARKVMWAAQEEGIA